MLRDYPIKIAENLEGLTHQKRIKNAFPIITKNTYLSPAFVHFSQFGKLFTRQILGNRSYRMNIYSARFPTQVKNLFYHLGTILGGSGIGHSKNAGISTFSGRSRTGIYGFSIFSAWFAQMSM